MKEGDERGREGRREGEREEGKVSKRLVCCGYK